MLKSKTEVVFVPRTYYYTLQDNASSQTFEQTRSPYIGERTVTKEEGLPGWQYLIANGLNATTALAAQEVSVDDTVSDFGYTMWYNTDQPQPWAFQTIDIQGPLMSQIPPSSLGDSPGLLPEAEDLAIQKFYEHLAATQAQFQGMVFAGELAETLRMIKRPAEALRHGIGDYLGAIKRWAHGNRASRRKKQSFVRDTWLEYSFGWKPLISDIEDGMTAFYTSRWPKPVFQMVKSKGKKQKVSISPQHTWDVGNGIYIFYDVETRDEANVKFYGVYHSEGSGPSAFRHYGFSPWEFVPTLWELIPYSFLVDYFTNIGEIISAWSYRHIGVSWASKGIEFKSSLKTTNIAPKYLGSQVPPHKWVAHGSPGSSTASRRTVARIPSVSIELPSLHLKVPGMQSLKWLNIAALSIQLKATRRSLRSP